MADIIKFGSGRGSIEVSGEVKTLIESTLKSAEKELYEGIEKEIQALKVEAQKKWPVRQKRKNRAGKVIPDSVSKDSRGKFRTQIRLVPPATIIGSVSNEAEYAYMIRTSEKFQSVTAEGGRVPVKDGARVVDKVLFQPGMKAAKRLAKIIAEKVMKDL